MNHTWSPPLDSPAPMPAATRSSNEIVRVASIFSLVALGLTILYIAVNLPGPALADGWHDSAAPRNLADVIHSLRPMFAFGLAVDSIGFAFGCWRLRKQPVVAFAISTALIATTLICSVLAFFVVGLGAAFNNSV